MTLFFAGCVIIATISFLAIVAWFFYTIDMEQRRIDRDSEL